MACAYFHEVRATYSLLIDEKTEAWRDEHSVPESSGARIPTKKSEPRILALKHCPLLCLINREGEFNLIMFSLKHLQDMQLKRCSGLGFRKELQATDMDLGHIFLYLVNEL